MSIISLCGGFPQGSLVGGDCYITAINDAADHIDTHDRFRYIDALQILELIMLSGILKNYNVYSHVPSDVPVDNQFLSHCDTQTQSNLDQLCQWTDQNQMLLNPHPLRLFYKSHYSVMKPH